MTVEADEPPVPAQVTPTPTTATAGRAPARHRGATSVSLVFFSLSLASVLALHVLVPELDPLTRYMSEYALGRFSLLMLVAFLALGAGSVALALALVPVAGRASAALVALWGVAMGALALFPTTTGGRATTEAARVHGTLLAVAEAALVAGIALASWRLRAVPAWQRLGRVALACGAITLASHVALVLVLAPPLPGLAQRIASLVTLAWLALAARAVATR